MMLSEKVRNPVTPACLYVQADRRKSAEAGFRGNDIKEQIRTVYKFTNCCLSVNKLNVSYVYKS